MDEIFVEAFIRDTIVEPFYLEQKQAVLIKRVHDSDFSNYFRCC